MLTGSGTVANRPRLRAFEVGYSAIPTFWTNLRKTTEDL
jgi:hypothetical protein